MSADSTVRAKIPSGGSTDSGSVRASGLRLVGVTKRLGGRRVIDDVNLEVAAGSLLGLLGPSGCGKTTMLRMIGGFLRPDEGRIEIDSEDVTALGPERRPTAMVFQSFALWP
jgi:putative spermidine/putrescine transport system ATP-binding protein